MKPHSFCSYKLKLTVAMPGSYHPCVLPYMNWRVNIYTRVAVLSRTTYSHASFIKIHVLLDQSPWEVLECTFIPFFAAELLVWASPFSRSIFFEKLKGFKGSACVCVCIQLLIISCSNYHPLFIKNLSPISTVIYIYKLHVGVALKYPKKGAE